MATHGTYVTDNGNDDIRITGTRVTLDSIIHAYWNGESPEAVVLQFPSLTPEQVYGAVAYYLHNKAEMDAYMKRQAGRWEESRRKTQESNDPLLERIRAARSLEQPGFPRAGR